MPSYKSIFFCKTSVVIVRLAGFIRKFYDWPIFMGAKVIFFDLDNTLINTHEIFVQKRNDMLLYISPFVEPRLLTDIEQSYEALLAEGYGMFSVDPKKLWGHVFVGLKKKYPFLARHLDGMQRIIWSIYTQVPRLHEGAHEVLGYLRENAFLLGLVTHAEKPWTDFKLDAHGLRGYFHKIFICPVTIHKGPAVWIDAMRQFPAVKEETLVIGDSVSGDIIASYEAGVRKHIWVQITKGWDVYKKGIIPENTRIVTSLGEIIAQIPTRGELQGREEI